MTMNAARLARVANRLGELEAGSAEADAAIHRALGRTAPAPSYTTDEGAARSLLPDGFEWLEPVHSAGVVYVACRRSGMDGEFSYPHHGASGRTALLAACAAALRAHSSILRR